MKIRKNEIEFFSSYVSEDATRAIMQNLFLDLSNIREQKFDDRLARYGRLVATDGFCMGSLEVELNDEDRESYMIPFKQLLLAKNYVEKLEKLEVVKDEKHIYFKTKKATIQIEYEKSADVFPSYEKIIPSGEGEYAVKIDTELLRSIMSSYRKLGTTHVVVRMNGSGRPIGFEADRSDIKTVLMPVRIYEEEKLGKLQKISK